MKLSNFLEDEKINNAWIRQGPLRVYVRRSVRLYEKIRYNCFDVASIEALSIHRGKGIFTRFLALFEAEALAEDRCIYVENVLNARLLEFFRKRNYEEINDTGIPCFIKLKI